MSDSFDDDTQGVRAGNSTVFPQNRQIRTFAYSGHILSVDREDLPSGSRIWDGRGKDCTTAQSIATAYKKCTDNAAAKTKNALFRPTRKTR